MTDTTKTIRTILGLDALTCLAAGAAMSLGAGLLAGPTGLHPTLLLVAGCSLFPVAALFGWMARTPLLNGPLVMLAVIGNAGWVAASIAVAADDGADLVRHGVRPRPGGSGRRACLARIHPPHRGRTRICLMEGGSSPGPPPCFAIASDRAFDGGSCVSEGRWGQVPRRDDATKGRPVTDSEDQDTPDARRGVPARIGICLLNLLSPGLGLLRLSRPRWWLGYSVLIALAGATLLSFGLIRNMSFRTYILLLGFCLVVVLAAYLGSIWHSWRFSAVRDPAPRWWSRWYGLVLVWAAATLLTWPLPDLFRGFYRPFYVPSEAMAPTLGINDRLLADMRIVDAPKRGDVVIVHTGTVDYVKRIAALPGDRIAMRDGVVVLNGQQVAQTLIERAKVRDADNMEVERRTLAERFPGEDHTHQVIDLGPSDGDDRAEIRLGAGQYFLLGDNRDRSADSRFGVAMSGLGVVDRPRITGRVLYVYWRPGAGLGEIRPYIP